MADDPGYVWMTNTGTGPIAVPNNEVEGKLLRGWIKIGQTKAAPKPKVKKKE